MAAAATEAEEEREEGEDVVNEEGVVPVPVAAIIEGSACRRSHSIVWPSDLWPSSRVSWKTLAAQIIGMRMRRPRPSTLLWRSLQGFLTAGAVVVMADEEEACGGGGAGVGAGMWWWWEWRPSGVVIKEIIIRNFSIGCVVEEWGGSLGPFLDI